MPPPSKHSDHRKDWEPAMYYALSTGIYGDGPSIAYLIAHPDLEDGVNCSMLYVGATHADETDDQIVASHARGSRKSTRKWPKWIVRFMVRGFPNRTAAQRFERRIKIQPGGARPKLAMARKIVNSKIGRFHNLSLELH
jgi:hypothetical protein